MNPARVLPCPLAAACDGCGRMGAEPAAYEADTPVGVLCLTVCPDCAEVGRTPRLSCPDAVRRVMAHCQHMGGNLG